ncbi:AraC family transcriptional regulator [Flavobacterium sp. LM4]|nr:AraC family transcriptional regulator [Flavobacterium sp. LM4]
MKIRLHSADLGEIFLESSHNGSITKQSDIVEVTHKNEFFFGKGEYKELYFDGIHIGYGNIEVAKTTIIQVDTDMETVEMHFALSGNSQSICNDTKKSIEFGINQHNIIYANQFKGEMIWSPNTGLQIFEVNLLPQFFANFLPEQGVLFKNFAKIINKKTTGFLNKHNLRITVKMHSVINEIISCNRKGIFKKMLIQAKVIELLLLQLEQMSEHECEVFCSLKKKDIEKMHNAKELILANLNTPCSLITLAHQVGTNEFTLKKGFKEVFGTTVFGLINDEKMELAKKMLLEEGFAVNQVSELIGYKNPQHFTTAFKKKYGIVPSAIK